MYVDDFKLAGPIEHMDKMWKAIRTPGKKTAGIVLDDPSESGRVASLQPYYEIDLPVANRSISKLAYERQPELNPD